MGEHTVAFQGEYGAYSEEAARAVYPQGQPLPHRTLRDVVTAVASRSAATAYALQILAEDIETSQENYTRFLALGRAPAQAPRTKTSLVMSTSNTPGALYHALGPFAARGVNMTKLESRPSRARPWGYSFCLDVEGAGQDATLRAALNALHGLTPPLAVLGSYRPSPARGAPG